MRQVVITEFGEPSVLDVVEASRPSRLKGRSWWRCTVPALIPSTTRPDPARVCCQRYSRPPALGARL